MNLALGFILRNESFLLGKILELLSARFDLVLALDYGSEDGTVDILRDRKVIYQERKWEDNYSKARNDLMKLARHHGATHILMLDGDEVIFPESVVTLRQCRNEPGGSMPRVNLLPGGRFTDGWPDLQTRFLNLSCNIEFRNNVHEVPFPVGQELPLQLMPQTALLSEVVIYHYSLLKPVDYIWRKEHNYQRLMRGEKSDWKTTAPASAALPHHEKAKIFYGRLPIEL